MMTLKSTLRSLFRKTGRPLFGSKPRLHTVPFGPIKGKQIYMSFDLSPRMFFGLYDPWITEVAFQNLMPGSVAYDIGAHVGYTALLFSHILKESGEVHAFEILPSVANNFLTKTVAANSFGNIRIHNVGLGSSAGTIRLPVIATKMTSLMWEDGDETLEHETCQTDSLDHYMVSRQLPSPTFIKVDIEGGENDFLLGSMNTIDAYRPALLIEFHTGELAIGGIAILSKLGYRIVRKTGRVLSAQDIKPHFHESVLCFHP